MLNSGRKLDSKVKGIQKVIGEEIGDVINSRMTMNNSKLSRSNDQSKLTSKDSTD